MVHNHTWFVAPWAIDGSFAFDFAATPSYEGTVTSKMHADTFQIPEGTDNPEEAFTVLVYLLSPEIAPQLLEIYGAQPSRLSLQEGYFETYMENNYPGMEFNTNIIVDSVAYADNPNHESWMPSFLETTDKYNEFWNYLANTPDLDVDAEIEGLREDLQTIFDAYFEANP
jgi:multiple sugar transport system substrate-binding protein